MEIKKILFIAPATAWAAYPPLGILSIAAFIREQGYEVEILDYSGLEIDRHRVERDIARSNSDVVALGVLTGPGIPRAMMVSDVAKSLGKYVIWGGPHPTILPGMTLGYQSMDAVILGEGEYALRDLLLYLQQGGDKPQGVWVKEGGDIFTSKPQESFVDMNTKPMPAWELLKNIDRYFPYPKHNLVIIEATRGCPYRCGFCHHANDDVKDFGGFYREVAAAKVMEQFDYVLSLTKRNVDRMDIGGDLHLTNERYSKKFIQDMVEIGGGVKWLTVSRFDLMTREIAEMLGGAGCDGIMLGVESGSKRIQKMLGKMVDLEKAVIVAKTLRKNKILLTNTYMMGHPDETLDELKMTLHYMKRIPADQNLLQIYRPFPGTPYFDVFLSRFNIKIPMRLEDYTTFGVLGHHANISKIPTKKLYREFYRVNMLEQTRHLINMQRYYWRNQMYSQFFDGVKNNKFTFKLKEYLAVGR